jgi:flagellar L-ring protein precursor FlgH
MMKKFSRLVFVLAAAMLLTTGVFQEKAEAVSLWADNASMNLFGDHKAHQVGDILTIVISESSSARKSNSASNSKDGEQNMAAGTGIFHFLASASASQSDSFSANGSLSNTNAVSGRITVQVVEVKPNGNLVISGTQSIKQNRDEQKITVTGVVRPEDVTPSNTVLSSKVADANIEFDGKGPLNRKQRQGIITQILNFIF